MPFQIHPLEALAQLKPIAVPDPIDRAGKLADVQNALQSGQLQQQQIAQNRDIAKTRQASMQADADVVRIMQGAKIDPDGTLDSTTENALIQNGSPHAQAILTNLSTVGVRKSTMARDAALTQQGKDTLAETKSKNAADALREQAKIDLEKTKPIAVPEHSSLVSPTGTILLQGSPTAKTQTEYDQKIAAFNADPQLSGKYGQGPNGYEKWQQDLMVQRAGATSDAKTTAAKSTDPRLAGVDPKDYTEAKKEAFKVENLYVAAQRASDDLGSFVSGAKAGNRVAAQYSPVEAVLQINAGAGVKRINRQEIDQMQGAGSIFDRIAGWAGHATAGQPIPPNILSDMQNLSDLLAGNAKTQRDRGLQAVDKIYNSTFSSVPAAPSPTVPTGKQNPFRK